jgi:hypothetical protein
MRPLFVELVNEVRLKPAVTVQCQEGPEIESQCRRTIGEENGTGDSSTYSDFREIAAWICGSTRPSRTDPPGERIAGSSKGGRRVDDQ